jgi:hypothetical protein
MRCVRDGGGPQSLGRLCQIAFARTRRIAAATIAARAGGDDDLERIAKSADELAKSGGAQFRGTTTTETAGADAKVTFDGRFHFSQRAGEYVVDAAAIGLLGSGQVRALLVDGTMYFSLDALEGEDRPDLAGKKWLRLDPTVLGEEGQLGQTDPNGSIDALRGVTGNVEDLGTETIRGVRTTHYRVRINPALAVRKASEDARELARDAVRPFGSRVIPAHVWIDDADRLRKLRFRVGDGSLANPRGSVGFEYFDLGADVSVVAPPPEDVVDFTDILGGAPDAGS